MEILTARIGWHGRLLMLVTGCWRTANVQKSRYRNMTDPMTGYEQAEADAVERHDEAMREEHWREAEQAARTAMSFALIYKPAGRESYATWVLGRIDAASSLADSARYDCFRTLASFHADYGTPALLRVIATALEAGK